MALLLPTAGEQLGTGLDKLIAGINHAINPDYGFQQAMKAQLATNPKLVTALADLEVQAPGTLKKLGFGPLTGLLQAVPESPEGQFRRTSGQDIVAGEQAKLAADTGAAKLQANLHGKVLAAIGNSEDPNAQKLASDYISRFMSGQNIAQQKESEAIAAMRQGEAQLEAAKLPGEIEKAKFAQTQFEDLQKNYPDLVKIDPFKLLRDAQRGIVDPKQMLQYAQMPGGKEMIDTARIMLDLQDRLDQQKLLKAQFGHQIDLEERQKILTAGAALKLTHTGTLDAWRTVLEHPETVATIQEKAKAGKPLSFQESAVLHANDAQEQQQQIIDQKQAALDQAEQLKAGMMLRQSYFTAQNAIKNASTPEGFAAGLAQMNSVVGPLGYQARFGSPPKVGQVDKLQRQRGGLFSNDWFTPGNQLFFVDANNKRVDPEEIFVNKQYQQQAKMNQAATNFVMQYNSDTDLARKKANLEKLKAEQPETYNLIKDKIKE